MKNDEAYEIPIVLFVFRRIDTVMLIIEQLRMIKPSKMYIYSDGARMDKSEEEKVNALRMYLDSAIDWDCEIYKGYAQKNKGCARNICEGVSDVFEKEKWAIILEDDVVPSSSFWVYARQLLKTYEGNKGIQYISGFNAVGDCDFLEADYCFSYNGPLSGAFATWADRWNECDFSMKEWPKIKKERLFRRYFMSLELYHHYEHAFDEAYKGNNEGWDYQFEYDKLSKGRLTIVPKYNLASNIGFDADALHGVDSRKAMKMKEMLTGTKKELNQPMIEPSKFENHIKYSALRQKLFLEVNGNYIYRHMKYMKSRIKDCAYKILPRGVWNSLKRIL